MYVYVLYADITVKFESPEAQAFLGLLSASRTNSQEMQTLHSKPQTHWRYKIAHVLRNC